MSQNENQPDIQEYDDMNPNQNNLATKPYYIRNYDDHDTLIKPEKVKNTSHLGAVIAFEVFTGLSAITALVSVAGCFIESNYYLRDYSHFLFCGGFHTVMLIGVIGMAYNRLSFGVFFERRWRCSVNLVTMLLILPEFDPARPSWIDYSSCIAIGCALIMFVMSFFIVDRAENCVQDGGLFDYIADFQSAY